MVHRGHRAPGGVAAGWANRSSHCWVGSGNRCLAAGRKRSSRQSGSCVRHGRTVLVRTVVGGALRLNRTPEEVGRKRRTGGWKAIRATSACKFDPAGPMIVVSSGQRDAGPSRAGGNCAWGCIDKRSEARPPRAERQETIRDRLGRVFGSTRPWQTGVPTAVGATLDEAILDPAL